MLYQVAAAAARRPKEEMMTGERATKMLILSSARTLFAEKGYDNTPVEEICVLAGIAKGTFFYHFESKQAIVRYILASQIREYALRLKEQMDTFKDAIAKAEYFIAALLECRSSGYECATYFKQHESAWYTTVLREERSLALLPLFELVIEEGIAQGYFRIGFPHTLAAVAFFGIDTYLHMDTQGAEDTRRGIREMAAKTLGLKEAEFAI